MIGKHMEPLERLIFQGGSREGTQHTENLAAEDERMTGEAADRFARDPGRIRLPSSIAPDLADKNRGPGCANVSDLPRPEGNAPEVAGESRPIFSAVQ